MVFRPRDLLLDRDHDGISIFHSSGNPPLGLYTPSNIMFQRFNLACSIPRLGMACQPRVGSLRREAWCRRARSSGFYSHQPSQRSLSVKQSLTGKRLQAARQTARPTRPCRDPAWSQATLNFSSRIPILRGPDPSRHSYS